MPLPFRQLALQLAALVLTLLVVAPYYHLQGQALPLATTFLLCGPVAFLLARLARLPWWWQCIHGLFLPAAWFSLQLPIDPDWFLVAALLLALSSWGALQGQIPLYLSNRATCADLVELLQQEARPLQFIDLGAGVGSTLRPLAQAFPDSRFTGIDNAPLTSLIGWLRCRRLGNIRWKQGNLWAEPLNDYQVAYAFLSPAPMAELWEKVRSEMPAGSLFISNSFPVPELEPNHTLIIPGRIPRQLYCYRL